MTNKTKNKGLKIAIGILSATVIAGAGIYVVNYHGESPDYISTQKSIDKANQKRLNEFNKIKSEEIPTVNQANQYMVKNYGKNWSKMSFKKQKKVLTNEYGSNNALLLMDGSCLSTSMTPYQEQQQEIGLAQQDDKRTDYVGFQKNQYITSVMNPTQVETQSSGYTFGTDIIASNNGTLEWFSLGDGYSVSSPVIPHEYLSSLLQSKSSDNVIPCLLFIQVPNKEVQKTDFMKEVHSLKLSVNDSPIELYQNGLSATKMTNNRDLDNDKCTQIYPNSIVPVVFNYKPDTIPSNTKISDMLFNVNGHSCSVNEIDAPGIITF